MIKSAIRSMVLAALLVVLVGQSAWAENGPTTRLEHWDFSLQTRYIGSVDISRDGGSSVAIEDDLGWGFGFGYNMSERLNIGFFTSWRNPNYTATRGVNGIAVDSLNYSGYLEVGTIALSAEYLLLPKKITPYVSGAIGYSFVDTNIPSDVYSACWYDPWYGYMCYTDVATFGEDGASYSLSVGLRVEASEAVFFRAAYEYDWIDLGEAVGASALRIDGGLMF